MVLWRWRRGDHGVGMVAWRLGEDGAWGDSGCVLGLWCAGEEGEEMYRSLRRKAPGRRLEACLRRLGVSGEAFRLHQQNRGICLTAQP
ncbi:hypothetical protein ACFX13_014639 [Malus domestica]